jgi:N-acetylglucosamine kinase-like BadF-type ATPase
MNRTLAIGMDVGGSRSAILGSVDRFEPREQAFVGTWKYSDIGVEVSAERCAMSILGTFPAENWDVLAVVIAMSGASDETTNAEFVRLFIKHFCDKEVRAIVEADSSFTLKAAYPNNESGYLLICGTGCVAIVQTIDGRTIKVGGWGRMLGDEGSGYWIGLEALKYYTRVVDSAETGGRLFERIEQEAESRYHGDIRELRSALYAGSLNPAILAQFVFELSDDEAARMIIQVGARHLASQVRLLERRAEGRIANVLTLHGSVACNPIYATAIATAIGKHVEIRLLDQKQLLEFAIAKARAV